MTQEELATLMKAKLATLKLFPHQRLGFPPMCQGKDVAEPVSFKTMEYRRIVQ